MSEILSFGRTKQVLIGVRVKDLTFEQMQEINLHAVNLTVVGNDMFLGYSLHTIPGETEDQAIARIKRMFRKLNGGVEAKVFVIHTSVSVVMDER